MKYAFLPLLFSLFFLSVRAQDSECGTVMPPGYAQTLQQRIAAHPTVNPAGGLVVIPVQVHLIRESSGNSVLTLQDIQTELDCVNVFYANAGLIFFECQAAEMIDDDDLYDYLSTTEQSILINNHYATNVLNLYFANTVSTSNGPVCGYSWLPPWGYDACFIAANCAVNGSSLAHEIGHYFGLPHTHGGTPDELVDGSNCATEGDYICDTPADPGLSGLVDSNCNYTGTATDANGMAYQPDVTNIMSYSRKACRTSFTPMQYAIINATYYSDRYYLSCLPTGSSSIRLHSITLFPNPALDRLHVSGLPADNETRTISLYDISGRIVLSEAILPGKSDAEIALNGLEDGTYLCTIYGAAGRLFTDRVIVRR